MQLYPAISWGLVTTVLPPATIEKKVQALYFKSLLLMGINGNIKKEWQSLPMMYQGLGLPCFPLVALAKKISFLQENWGSSGVAQSDALSLAYDGFLMEVGLYGNPLAGGTTPIMDSLPHRQPGFPTCGSCVIPLWRPLGLMTAADRSLPSTRMISLSCQIFLYWIQWESTGGT
jgi:hypothetical protein